MPMKKQRHPGLTIPMRAALAAAVTGAVAVRPASIFAPRSGVTHVAHSTLRALANMRLIKPREGQTAEYVGSLRGIQIARELELVQDSTSAASMHPMLRIPESSISLGLGAMARA